MSDTLFYERQGAKLEEVYGGACRMMNEAPSSDFGYFDECSLSGFESLSDGTNSFPVSPDSDWSSSSTATTSSTCQSIDGSLRKALKSALKRRDSPSKPQRRVHWHPQTIFETRPFTGRRRPRPTSFDTDEEAQQENSSLCVKKIKASECTLAGPHRFSPGAPTLPSSSAYHNIPNTATTIASQYDSVKVAPAIGVPIFPEASRVVIPSYNFSSVLSLSPKNSALESQSNQQQESAKASELLCSSEKKFVPFSFTSKRRAQLNTASSLLPTTISSN